MSNPNAHRAIIKYMAKAGDSYCLKRKMLSELLGKIGVFPSTDQNSQDNIHNADVDNLTRFTAKLSI